MKKFIGLALVLAAACMVFASCGSSGSSGSALNLGGSTIAGEVTSVSGKNVTITLGVMASGLAGMRVNPGNGQTSVYGNPPSGGTSRNAANGSGSADNTAQSGGDTANSGGTTVQIPDNAGSGTLPQPSDGASGNIPQLPSGATANGGGFFMAGTSTAVLTIQDESVISNSSGSAKLSDIQAGDILVITFDNSGKLSSVTISDASAQQNFQGRFNSQNGGSGSGAPGGQTGQGGPVASSDSNNGTAAVSVSADNSITGEKYSSAAADDNAVRVDNSAAVSFTNVTVNKTGDTTSTDNSDFYGQNAGLLVQGGASLTMTGGSISTDAAGGNGAFSYGSGSSLSISGTAISTKQDNSGGIDAAGGGSVTASGLTIDTQGASSAAIRSDRGGGTIAVDGGAYATHGTGSPAIYSTADISVRNAALTASASEGVVIEGMNSVKLTDCDVTGNMTGTYGAGSGENIHAVMIYQSMSGDASQGQGSFTMSGGSLTSQNGDTFYVTNTSALISLSGVSITNANGNFLTVAGNDGSRGWGTQGQNGGACELDANGQTLAGNVTVDDISSLKMNLSNSSDFTGSVNNSGQAGTVDVTVESGSTWTLTGDSYVTSFTGDASSVAANGYHLYVNGTQLV